MSTVRLILASRSPRRAALLREAGYTFEQTDPPFKDPAQPQRDHRPPADVAMTLAKRKAMSVVESQRDRGDLLSAGARPGDGPVVVIIGADTICVGVDGQLLGQPADVDEARRMIGGFVAATHDVVTGVALVRLGGGAGNLAQSTDASRAIDTITFADTVPVTFDDLPPGALDDYLAGGEWRGKAGGYNLHDRQRAGWPLTVPDHADADTVVGLPMRILTEHLRAWSIEPTPQHAPAERDNAGIR